MAQGSPEPSDQQSRSYSSIEVLLEVVVELEAAHLLGSRVAGKVADILRNEVQHFAEAGIVEVDTEGTHNAAGDHNSPVVGAHSVAVAADIVGLADVVGGVGIAAAFDSSAIADNAVVVGIAGIVEAVDTAVVAHSADVADVAGAVDAVDAVAAAATLWWTFLAASYGLFFIMNKSKIESCRLLVAQATKTGKA